MAWRAEASPPGAIRALHVSMAYPPTTRLAGPPAQLHALVSGLRSCGVDARVVTTDADPPGRLDVPTNRWIRHEDVPVFYARCWATRYFVAPAAARAIRESTRASDLVHLSQVWSWLTIASASAARRVAIPFIVSPRGGFNPNALEFSSLKKAVFNRLGGRRAIAGATAFHATSGRERDDVAAYVPGPPVSVIPNCVDVPDDAALARCPPPDPATRTVLFLGRLHPIKNLAALLKSWPAVVRSVPSARLLLVGPDERGHRQELERLAGQLDGGATITFGEPVSGDAKSRLIAASWCLVLPSHTENFGSVVAEALVRRVPVVASRGTPWSELPARGCGWWTEADPDSLAAALSEALALAPDRRDAMGARGRDWVRQEFGVAAVARGMKRWYEELLARR